MSDRILKWIIAALILVVIALFSAPFLISEPTIQKAFAKDFMFIAAGLFVLALAGFSVNMLSARQRRDGPPKKNDRFANYSLFDAKVHAMHERARKGLHMYPEGHICKTVIKPMQLLLEAVDPDDVIVDCYGNDKEGFRTRFYGSLDGGTTWYEISPPSTPADRKTLLKVALGLASVHEYANKVRMESRERVLFHQDKGTEIAPLSSWEADTAPSREERTLHLDKQD